MEKQIKSCRNGVADGVEGTCGGREGSPLHLGKGTTRRPAREAATTTTWSPCTVAMMARGTLAKTATGTASVHSKSAVTTALCDIGASTSAD